MFLLSGARRDTTPDFFEKQIELLLVVIVVFEVKDLVNDLVDIQPPLTFTVRVFVGLQIPN